MQENKLHCSECNKTFLVVRGYAMHMESHNRPISCFACDRKFDTSDKFQEHVRTSSFCKPFACSECGQTFVRKGDLNAHMKIHTGEKLFECEYCKKTFARRHIWKRHVKANSCRTEETAIKIEAIDDISSLDEGKIIEGVYPLLF